MAHEKAYLICENKCLVEGVKKETAFPTKSSEEILISSLGSVNGKEIKRLTITKTLDTISSDTDDVVIYTESFRTDSSLIPLSELVKNLMKIDYVINAFASTSRKSILVNANNLHFTRNIIISYGGASVNKTVNISIPAGTFRATELSGTTIFVVIDYIEK